MELRVLRYFLTVAQAESISAAAEVLHVTQPTLSRQLMELEAELGTKLFARGRKKRRMALTEAGSRLRWQAEEILALRLAVMHNLYFYNKLTQRIRDALDAGEFAAFRAEYSTKLSERV